MTRRAIRIRPRALWLAACTTAGACGSMKLAPRASEAMPGASAGAEASAAPGAAPFDVFAPTARAAGAGDDQDAAALNRAEQGGWAVEREFAPASYDPADTGPRRDFRETIFWSPTLRTGADGIARVTFPTSDAITSFRITAEGTSGALPGRGEAMIASRLPVALAANLPVEVTTGDRVAVPVAITNSTGAAVDAMVHASAGASLALVTDATRAVRVPARSVRTVTYKLDVVGADAAAGAGDLTLTVDAGAAHDELRRSLAIAPAGFPAEFAAAGTVDGVARTTLVLPSEVVPGSAHTTIKLYPSPVATMTAAVDSIVREPSGCFEQASSANYPNVMVLAYLKASGASSPDVAAQATAALDHGYQLLTGYESAHHGFEWFGADPGHEALTAYGLLEFREMAEVYDVDATLVDRTAAWLRARRDGKGGYQRNAAAIDSFGRASADVTDAYITYALAEAGEHDLGPELARAREVGATTTDPYVLALSAAAVLAADPADAAGAKAVDRLAAMAATDGSFTGAAESITMSGGQALAIETTALAALAMMKAGKRHAAKVAASIEWITAQRGEWGGFASTQATVLALKALAAHAATHRIPAGATISVALNGTPLGTTTIDGDAAIELADLGPHLLAGPNVIELRTSGGARVDYSVGAHWSEAAPTSSPRAKIQVAAALDRVRVRAGRPVRLTATIENTTDDGQPMTLARIGIPGGLTYQPWQLDELVARHTVDFVETRPREVILYLRQMKPRERRSVPIQLLAQVPGRYTAAPSAAYLYYTDEDRHYARPVAVEIRQPIPKKRRPATTAGAGAPTPTAPSPTK